MASAEGASVLSGMGYEEWCPSRLEGMGCLLYTSDAADE